MHAATSSGCGSLLPGGLHFTMLAIYTSCLFSPIAPMILARSSPAGPTKGRPDSSSIAPGPSPTNRRDASRAPSPNTTFFLVLLRGHALQFMTLIRNRSISDDLSADAGVNRSLVSGRMRKGPAQAASSLRIWMICSLTAFLSRGPGSCGPALPFPCVRNRK